VGTNCGIYSSLEVLGHLHQNRTAEPGSMASILSPGTIINPGHMSRSLFPSYSRAAFSTSVLVGAERQQVAT
jgi:hypothetical protein